MQAEIEAQRKRKPMRDLLIQKQESQKVVKVDHDMLAVKNNDNSSELSGLNLSQHSSSTNKLLKKRQIDSENKRIDGLVMQGGRSVSLIRQGARKVEKSLSKKKINNYFS